MGLRGKKLITGRESIDGREEDLSSDLGNPTNPTLRQHISETEHQRKREDLKTSETNETDRRLPVEE